MKTKKNSIKCTKKTCHHKDYYHNVKKCPEFNGAEKLRLKCPQLYIDEPRHKRNWRDREDTRIANKRTYADRMNSYNHGYGYEDS